MSKTNIVHIDYSRPKPVHVHNFLNMKLIKQGTHRISDVKFTVFFHF